MRLLLLCPLPPAAALRAAAALRHRTLPSLPSHPAHLALDASELLRHLQPRALQARDIHRRLLWCLSPAAALLLLLPGVVLLLVRTAAAALALALPVARAGHFASASWVRAWVRAGCAS